MKTLFWILSLAATGTACQPQASKTQAAAAPEPEGAVAGPKPEPQLPSLFAAADTLTAPMRELLRQHDLSILWEGNTHDRRANPTLDGFFGPDHYRFALVFNEVSRDGQHPEVYHVRGKCRYRKNIRPFAGTLRVRQIADLDAPYDYDDFSTYEGNASPSAEVPEDSTEARYMRARRQSQPYTLRAQLQLTEAQAENSGLFEGEAILNFHIAKGTRLDYVLAPFVDKKAPARGTGILVRGSRRNLTTKQVKQFVVSDNVFAAAPDIYKDFGVGDRGGEINPKYARLGWNDAWENNEWWADSPRPSLSLSATK